MNQAQYQREIEAIARKLATQIPTTDRDHIEAQLWSRYVDEWAHLIKAKKDDVIVEDIARIISNLRQAEGDEIAGVLSELGFSGIGTGGGCEAYYLALTDDEDEGPHFLITDYDCGVPGTWSEEVMLGYYDSFGSQEGDPVHFDSMRELVKALQKGTAHPQLGKAAAPVESKVFVQADLDLVNRHRASLGMGAIDPAAGWTASEITDMANSIRDTGRMANPAVLPLIEIPRR